MKGLKKIDDFHFDKFSSNKPKKTEKHLVSNFRENFSQTLKDFESKEERNTITLQKFFQKDEE